MNAQTLTLQMSIIVEPDDDGSFHAYCPAFTEVHVCGATEPEAMKHVEDAIVVHLQSLARHGEPLPCCNMKNEPVSGGRLALRSVGGLPVRLDSLNNPSS